MPINLLPANLQSNGTIITQAKTTVNAVKPANRNAIKSGDKVTRKPFTIKSNNFQSNRT